MGYYGRFENVEITKFFEESTQIITTSVSDTQPWNVRWEAYLVCFSLESIVAE